jgi:hypothetical protein
MLRFEIAVLEGAFRFTKRSGSLKKSGTSISCGSHIGVIDAFAGFLLLDCQSFFFQRLLYQSMPP